MSKRTSGVDVRISFFMPLPQGEASKAVDYFTFVSAIESTIKGADNVRHLVVKTDIRSRLMEPPDGAAEPEDDDPDFEEVEETPRIPDID